jgi:hypothetical protein
MKLVLQLVLLGILFGYPLALGQSPLAYHEDKLLPAQPEHLLEALLLALSSIALGTLVEVRAGWISLEPRYGFSKSLRKVAQGFLTPLPLAFVEEGIFRGIVLEQTIPLLPRGWASTLVAIASSAAVFSLVHFIRPARTYAPVIGLFFLGCLLGAAYLVGGHTYWLPAGLHAGGILAIQILRPFVVYRGPAWLIGYRSYPLAGGIGIGVMLLLGLYVAARFGGGAGP